MPEAFLLDTDAYFRLIFAKTPLEKACQDRLSAALTRESICSFYISEVSSLEIHSVLGKYRRGRPEQIQPCDRTIIRVDQYAPCPNKYVINRQKQLTRRVFRDLQKMVGDMEAQRGNIRAAILGLDRHAVERAKEILRRYADQYAIGSHDALICGTFINARETRHEPLTMVTLDKSFIAVLKGLSLPYFNPLAL